MKGKFSKWACVVLALAAMPAQAGIALVGHPDVATGAVGADHAAQLYLAKSRALGGKAVTVIDLPEGDPARVQFLQQVVGKDEQQVRGYWSRMIFTGKAQPPRVVGSSAEVVQVVGATPGAIGIVDSKAVTGAVKVLYRAD